MTTYETACREAAARLRAAGVPDAGFDALLLLEKASGLDRTRYELVRRDPVPEEVLARLKELTARRAQRIPLQHILGAAWFMGLPFKVTPDVLIPRPDTEVLVETVLETLPERGKGLRLLDLCAGSGCIGISLAKLGGFRDVVLSDISPEALAVARENAVTNGVADRIRLAEGDLWEARLTDSGRALTEERFDAVCCNPPYIPTGVIPALMPEVRDHDPRKALDGGSDGLDYYRRLSYGLRKLLPQGGPVFLEIGYDQGETVPEIFEGRCRNARVIRDLAGDPRVFAAQYLPAEEEGHV